MTTLTSKAVKKQLLASKTNALRSLNLEKALEYDLNKFFQNLKTQVLAALYEYYPMDEQGILLQGQADLILAPIFESQKEYYEILERYNKKEYRSGVRQAKRLVKLAKANVSARKSENTTNFNANNLVKIEKDDLFGTNDWTEEKLLKQSFIASEHTMNRVDKDINKILSDGYASGAGIKKVASNIEKRFNQLKTWEARRIARTEIHNAHEMGTLNTYQEMDVEYTQWSSAHDSRVRGLKPKDKANHVKMDGEIIPLGGTYSNGLQYPGDTKGPIYEWINCRCGNLPFIMPYGYIAPPGKAQFREEDLIQTLDYWNGNELTDSIIEYSSPVRGVEIEDVPLDSNLMNHEFTVPPSKEMMNEFGISKKGMDTIHQFQKDSFGSKIETGIAFSENNGKIYTGKAIGTTDSVTIRTPKKCSTIHNHTNKSFSPPSGDDFYTYLKNGKERLGINVSPKETWVMQHKNKTGLSNKKINKLANKVDELSYEYSQKFKKEYHTELDRINRTIKDPKLRQKELDKLKHKVNNEWLDRYNKELGDEILKEASKFEGLKVKRFENVKINKKEVKDLPKLKKEKHNDSLLKRSKQINNAPINKDKIEKIPSKIKNNKKVVVDSIETYTSYSGNPKKKIDSFVKSQNLKNKYKNKLAIWSGTGAESIKAFQLKDWDTLKKELRKKGGFFKNIYEVSRITYQLKTIINKRGNKLGENIILFKGIKSKDIDLSKFKVGEVNKFDTHMSTSLDYNTAKKFAKNLNDKGYIVVMYTHKKVRGAAINGSFNNAPEEYELLLSESQRYITYQIDEKERLIYIFVG